MFIGDAIIASVRRAYNFLQRKGGAANEHRADQAYPGSQAGTLSLSAPGKRAGGTAGPSTGTCACGHPIAGHTIPSILHYPGTYWCKVEGCICRLSGNDPIASPPLEPVTEEILAWRGWHLVPEGDDWLLRSPSYAMRWDGPSAVADQKPAVHTRNGLYAVKDRTRAGESYYVYGQVALSGIVLEGETGYRAERATIRSLVLRGLPEGMEDVAPITVMAALEERYQCEVTYEPAPQQPPQVLVQQAALQQQVALQQAMNQQAANNIALWNPYGGLNAPGHQYGNAISGIVGGLRFGP